MPPQFATQFRADFEAAMAALGVAHPHAIPPLQRAMAAFFFTFVPRTTSLYVALAQRMASAGWNGAVCSLNYERLLELSLGRARVQATVGIPTNAAKSVELCLPHGCCHIFCEGVRGSSQGISFTGFGVSTDGPVVVISNPIQHRQRIENDAFPPVMSYFEPNKRTTSGTSFIVGQRERWGQLARVRRPSFASAFECGHRTSTSGNRSPIHPGESSIVPAHPPEPNSTHGRKPTAAVDRAWFFPGSFTLSLLQYAGNSDSERNAIPAPAAAGVFRRYWLAS